MAKKMVSKLKCPKCGTEVRVEATYNKFFLYKCSSCKSNVVYFNDRIDVISDEMLSKIKKNKIFKCCGKATTTAIIKCADEVINSDLILDLKILLETSKDVEDFISKI